MRSRRAPAPEPTPPAPGRLRTMVGLLVAAALLALWSATCFIDAANFFVAGLTTLTPLVTVFALPVIAIAIGGRHPLPAVIAVAAAVVPWVLVSGYAVAGPGRTSIGTDSTLRVMSVNGAGGGADAGDIVRIARVYSADVIVVTELTSTLAHELTVAGLNSLAQAQWVQMSDDGKSGTGVWSRPIINDLQTLEELGGTGVRGMIAAGSEKIAITVAPLPGQPLRPGSTWHSDLEQLATRTPTTGQGFIVGDLQSTPWHPSFRAFTARGWRDAADVVGQGMRSTWPSWSPLPLAPLDHILVTGDVGVSDADTTNISGSNHRAIIATLVLRATVAGD